VTFQATYADPNGTSFLTLLYLLVNSSVTGVNGCFVYYNPWTNLLYLKNDTNTAWQSPALTPGATGSVSNSQCTLNGASSSVSVSGDDLTLDLALTFSSSSFTGAKNVYMAAEGVVGGSTGWVDKGTWTP